LLAFGHGASEDDVVDLFGVDGRDAGEGFLDGQGSEIIGARGPERAFVGAAYWGADGGDYYGFGHWDHLAALGGRAEAQPLQMPARKEYCWLCWTKIAN